jgi:hypothetical protein
MKDNNNFTELLKKDRIAVKKKSFENKIAKTLFDDLLTKIVSLNRHDKRTLFYEVPLLVKNEPIFDRLIVFSKLIKKFKEKKINVEYEKENINFILKLSW